MIDQSLLEQINKESFRLQETYQITEALKKQVNWNGYIIESARFQLENLMEKIFVNPPSEEVKRFFSEQYCANRNLAWALANAFANFSAANQEQIVVVSHQNWDHGQKIVTEGVRDYLRELFEQFSVQPRFGPREEVAGGVAVGFVIKLQKLNTKGPLNP